MGKKAKLYQTTRPEPSYFLLFLFSFALEAGRACSRPRQWKHGRELARLTSKTLKAAPWLQEIFKKTPVPCRNHVSYATLRLRATNLHTLSPDFLRTLTPTA
jgi:hypothetical protein